MALRATMCSRLYAVITTLLCRGFTIGSSAARYTRLEGAEPYMAIHLRGADHAESCCEWAA